MNPLRSLTVRDLEAIVILGETRHFGRAAERLGMAQPSLSALVRRVEKMLDTEIFERTSRRCVITPDGILIIDETQHILERLTRLTRLRDERLPLRGDVRLGQIPTLGPYLTPHVLPAIRTALPDLRLYFIEALTGEIIDMLRDGRLDVAILTRPTGATDLIELPLFEEELVLAIPPGHRLARAKRVSIADVSRDELILLEHGNCLRAQTLAACRLRDEDGAVAHATSIETLRFMVAAGVGCAILPALAARSDSASEALVEYRRFEDPVPTRSVVVAAAPRVDSLRRAEALGGVMGNLAVPALYDVDPAATHPQAPGGVQSPGSVVGSKR